MDQRVDDVQLKGTKAVMLLQIYFEVDPANAADFEAMYAGVYIPALRKQAGYIRSALLRVFPENMANEIDAAPTTCNYQMELVFDTEANRRQWVASPEHQAAWPKAAALARAISHRAYDIAGEDQYA
jgi:antibiotic biosynthesis monooxygenase (ABM) superfamily enzyme